MNNKKIIIVAICLIIILIIVKLTTSSSTENTLKNYLKEQEFTNEKESNLYSKQLSNTSIEEYENDIINKKDSKYEVIYFDIKNYQLIKNEMIYEDEIQTIFIPTYDFNKNLLTYTYRFVYNNTNVIFEGEYNLKTNKYTCENIYTYEFNFQTEKDEPICNKIKYDVEDFKEEVQLFLKNI